MSVHRTIGPLVVIRFVYLFFIFTTTMPFKLIYFYPPDTFMVKVKVTETLIFWLKIGNFENICQLISLFTYLGYN